MAYGDFVLQRDLNFTINRGDIFVIMGGSGSGKSTLLNHLLGLNPPAKGQVLFEGHSLWDAPPEERDLMLRRDGALHQSRALWRAMIVVEHNSFPPGGGTHPSVRQNPTPGPPQLWRGR